MKQPYFRNETLNAHGSPSYFARRLLSLFAEHYEALFEDAKVTYPQWTILMLLYGELSRTAADLARQMCHDAGAMTRLLHQLEDRGLVKRLRDTNDRRVVNLALTPSGHALAETLKPRVVDFLNTALEGFSGQDLTNWLTLTSKMVDALESQPVGFLESFAKEKTAR
jgi:DNA-binding MarR family transcriptional regulator